MSDVSKYTNKFYKAPSWDIPGTRLRPSSGIRKSESEHFWFALNRKRARRNTSELGCRCLGGNEAMRFYGEKISSWVVSVFV